MNKLNPEYVITLNTNDFLYKEKIRRNVFYSTLTNFLLKDTFILDEFKKNNIPRIIHLASSKTGCAKKFKFSVDLLAGISYNSDDEAFTICILREYSSIYSIVKGYGY